MEKISLAIVDDHQLVAQALSKLLAQFDAYSVLFKAANGKEMINYVQEGCIPDIVLLDINMPVMNGFETASWLKRNAPATKILALSMSDKEESVIGMLRNGASGYLLKDSRPAALKAALDNLVERGYHYTDLVANYLTKSLHLNKSESPVEKLRLTNQELTFLQFACSDLTYHEIAGRMGVQNATIDEYRESVFQKMGVKSRVSMAIEAIKLGLITLQ